jgi:hypothetical protein
MLPAATYCMGQTVLSGAVDRWLFIHSSTAAFSLFSRLFPLFFCVGFDFNNRYISPQRHVVEYVLITSCAILMLFRLRSISKNMTHTHSTTTTTNKPSSLNQKRDPIRPGNLMRFLTLVSVVLQMCYKCVGYSGKLYFWVMPCNVYQAIGFALAFWPNLSYEASLAMAQICIGYSGLAVVALATPDTSDLVLPGEKSYFFISHAVLVIYPYLFVLRGQMSMLPSSLQQSQRQQQLSAPKSSYTVAVLKNATFWWSFSCITFALFYFAFVTPLSIVSGLNLNYMLSPPANQDIVVGNHYRLLSILCVGTVFFIMRFIATLIELVSRTTYSIFIRRSTRLDLLQGTCKKVV